MVLDNFLVLLLGPLFLINVRVEMVMPTLSTLLAHPALQFPGNGTPITGSILGHETNEQLIFLFGLNSWKRYPGSFNNARRALHFLLLFFVGKGVINKFGRCAFLLCRRLEGPRIGALLLRASFN